MPIPRVPSPIMANMIQPPAPEIPEQEGRGSSVQCSVALVHYRPYDSPPGTRSVGSQAFFSRVLGSDYKAKMGLIPDPDDDQRTLDPEIESKRMCVTAAEVLNGLLQKALEDGHIFPDINGGYDEALLSWAIGVGAPAALDWELGSDHNFKCSVRECTKATIECDTLLIPSTNAEGNKTYTVKSRLRGLPEALGGQSVFSKAGLRTAGQELDSHLLTQVDEQIKAAATGDCPRMLSDPEVLEGLRSIGSDEFFKPLENFCLDCSLTSLNLGERPSDEAEGAKEETQ